MLAAASNQVLTNQTISNQAISNQAISNQAPLNETVSYNEAHQALQGILQDKLFHTPEQPTPWWMRALQWVFRHLHLNLGVHALRDVGLALVGVCVLLLVTAVVVVWRIMRQRAKGRMIHVALEQTDAHSLLEEAQKAYGDADYHLMLHFLIEAQLARAAIDGLIRLRPSKTLRNYRRELAKSDTELLPAFILCAETAEAVWFGKRKLMPEDAKRVLDTVTEALRPKGAEAS